MTIITESNPSGNLCQTQPAIHQQTGSDRLEPTNETKDHGLAEVPSQPTQDLARVDRRGPADGEDPPLPLGFLKLVMTASLSSFSLHA